MLPMNNLIAHPSDTPGKPDQTIADHLEGVTKLARDFASVFGAADYAELIAKAHDLGKIHSSWQHYVRNENAQQVNHSDVGATAIAMQEKYAFLGFIVACHHGGLKNFYEFREELKLYKKNKRVIETLEQANRCSLWTVPSEIFTDPPILKKSGELTFEFFLRILFSVLVDADFLDTEKYYSWEKSIVREERIPDIKKFTPLLFKHIAQLNSKNNKSVLNLLRNEILNTCKENAFLPQGIYRLTVPTGGGKTLSSLAFALLHAEKFNLRRIIVVEPFTSIIDQTVRIFRDIFSNLGWKAVLEHHSAKLPEVNDVWSDIAAENWDAPLIVTTTVQLFESLLGNKPSVCRKLHNIVGSVIIIDEFQALPIHLWDPIYSVLNELVEHYKVTVLLSTATQPPSEGLDSSYKLEKSRDIISQPSIYFERLKRVNFQVVGNPSPWDLEKLAEAVSQYPQVLVVMNTKKQVQELTQHLQKITSNNGIFTLSTSLCGKHRLEVIDEVRRRLTEGLPCQLICTQVIEAGVDLDFPVGYRIMGPLVSIVQTAGRINREGRLLSGGTLYIVNYIDKSMPTEGSYRVMTQQTENLLAAGIEDWHDPSIYKRYFELVKQLINNVKSHNIQQSRRALNYPEVARLFRIIPEETRPVVIRYGNEIQITEIDRLIEKLQYGGVRKILRFLQPYMVNLYPSAYSRNLQKGFIIERPIGPKNSKSGTRIGVWCGRYDKLFGLVEENLNPDEYIL
jgi:CRISPR-associated endonuclease/helicase Cas3